MNQAITEGELPSREIFMPDPVTLTASAIATHAFQEFVKSGAGELAKKFTAEAIAKMDDLRKTIWAKLRGKSEKVDEALTKAEQGDRAAIDTVTKYLDVAMEDYPDFATEIRAIAHQITLEQIQDNSSLHQINYGGTNYQTKTEPVIARLVPLQTREQWLASTRHFRDSLQLQGEPLSTTVVCARQGERD